MSADVDYQVIVNAFTGVFLLVTGTALIFVYGSILSVVVLLFLGLLFLVQSARQS